MLFQEIFGPDWRTQSAQGHNATGTKRSAPAGPSGRYVSFHLVKLCLFRRSISLMARSDISMTIGTPRSRSLYDPVEATASSEEDDGCPLSGSNPTPCGLPQRYGSVNDEHYDLFLRNSPRVSLFVGLS